jgi:quercetin dioxygenase-like cupin family protein
MNYYKRIVYLLVLVSNFIFGADLEYYSELKNRELIVAPSVNFTGKATVDYLFPKIQTGTFGGAYVTFEPNARTNWHIHPAGQHMIVTSGIGYTQEWGKKRVTLKAGDVIWCKPGVKHWHGASQNQPMTHLVISGVKDGKSVEWFEKVEDSVYLGELK